MVECYVNDLFVKEDGTGHPMLLIHGGCGHADVWGDSFSRLAAYGRVIAYDRRGYTRSRRPPTANHHSHGQDAAALLEQLSADPATVVGWSSGGIVALDLALDHPELVTSLVLVEPTYMMLRSASIGFYGAVARLLAAQLLRQPERGTRSFLRWVNSLSSGGSAFDRLDEDLRRSLISNSRALAVDFFRPTLALGSGEYLRRRIAEIRCPVALMRAEMSEPTLQRCSERLQKALPQTEVVYVPKTSHSLVLERPDLFVSTVRAMAERAAAVEPA